MIGAIWAQNSARVIGVDGKIPWRYRADLQRFKQITMGAAVVMGRLTYESIGKPLPGRCNIVLCRAASLKDPGPLPEGTEFVCLQAASRSVEDWATTVLQAVRMGANLRGDVWFIGGALVYPYALHHVDLIDVTYVPDVVPPEGAALAPIVEGSAFEPGPLEAHPDEPALKVRRFTRRTP